ncbi:hypothetical protein [Limnohabitans sp.]|uniref:hypothetical protein n=1 Tax=Limnohabitans sp. TaxID=1907725 RepID=UPI00286F6722|nr:hypothetical protein [Limnohabitans sp.]
MKTVKTNAKFSKQACNYRRDSDGFPYPLTLKDVPAQGYEWGSVSGIALMFDLFNWRKQLTDEQASDNGEAFVLLLMKEAARELEHRPDDLALVSHRGVAVGVLSGLAALVAYALESEDMRKLMEAYLCSSVDVQEKLILDELANEKATALNIRGSQPSKTGGEYV